MAQNRTFTEATRVQMPAMVHLSEIGYEYFGRLNDQHAETIFDRETNILLEVFKSQFAKLNPGQSEEADDVISQIIQELDNDDLGKSFYKRLIAVNPHKLIDFDEPSNNSFHFTGEFSCKNGNEEFRPDITLFINGLPLVFVEVKKPHNLGGMLEESKRMNLLRFPNRKFRKFLNITQLMIFSNNMEYDPEGGITPIQGAFYCTVARDRAIFNTFREENPKNAQAAPFHADYPYQANQTIESRILSDFNLQVIQNTAEYVHNKNFNTPTNRILTSMCDPERLLFLIRYGIAYARMEREIDGVIEFVDQKQFMRYQQFFASLAVRRMLLQGKKSGVIWHTQGSGKTALAFNLQRVLTDHFAMQEKVAKFYFIVDRLDLLEQASYEFEARGLKVVTANSRQELLTQFHNQQSQVGTTGEAEITVVNIQRFTEGENVQELAPYSANLQRIFMIDEAHRGYKIAGSFLANLIESDPDAVKIALTGTPLLKEDQASWKIFGEYIHTYYYDQSIRDGYTLKIIREDIESSYRDKLTEVHATLESLMQQKDLEKSEVVEHEQYVSELARYVSSDLKKFRMQNGDDSLGAMVVCETSTQARRLLKSLNAIQEGHQNGENSPMSFNAQLILFDSDDKKTRSNVVANFKHNSGVDILIVFNMLLTGFDAPRLKRIYLGRKLKDHNLLQALTRVNRPYGGHRYGYVVDFADIKKNFDETNQAYLEELNRFNADETDGQSALAPSFQGFLESNEELLARMRSAEQILFGFSVENLEVFSQEIGAIQSKDTLLDIRKALVEAREAINIARAFGDDVLKQGIKRFEIANLSLLLSEVVNAISIFNQKEAFGNLDAGRFSINEAMLAIQFEFRLKAQDELKVLAGQAENFNAKWRSVISLFEMNIDQGDPVLLALTAEFRKNVASHGFHFDSEEEYEKQNLYLDSVLEQLRLIKVRNDSLLRRYEEDEKFVRTHKRVWEFNQARPVGSPAVISDFETEILKILIGVKHAIDLKVHERFDILRNDGYFEASLREVVALEAANLGVQVDRGGLHFIQDRVAKEYLDLYRARVSDDKKSGKQ